MKKLSHIGVISLALFAMIFTSCEPDPIDGGGGGGLFDQAPTLTLVTETGFVSADETVDPGSSFTVKVEVVKGDADLNTFTLEEDFLKIDQSRFTVNGEASGANPKLIVGDDKAGLVWEVTISAHDAADTRNYNFEIEDVNGLTSSQSLNITVGGGTPPIVEEQGSGTYDADPSSLVSVAFVVGQGSSEIASVSVYENDMLITGTDRLFYGDTNVPMDPNPFPVPAEDKAGFSKSILIRAVADAGTNSYRVVVTDEFGESSSSEFVIVTGIAGTPVTFIQGVLFNRAGPTGTGGLDLDEAVGTGSASMLAEIKDEGVDTDLANDINWIKRISGVNGSKLKFMVPGLVNLDENFMFETIEVIEQIAPLVDNGTDLVDTNAAGELISYELEVNDIYLVENSGKFYLIQIKEINETPDNNNDNYVIDIKF